MNRDPNSDPSDPKTWGKNAIICDPWAKTVFPASEYLLKLKNYYYDKDSLTNKNCIEDFNPEKHILKPKPNLNLKYFNKHRNIEKLKTAFNNKCNNIAQTINTNEFCSYAEKNSLIEKINDLKMKIQFMSGAYREVQKKLIIELETLYKLLGVAEAWNLYIKEKKFKEENYFGFDNSETNNDDSEVEQSMLNLSPSHLDETIQNLPNNWNNAYIFINKDKQQNNEVTKETYLDFEQWKLSIFSSNLDDTIDKMINNWNNSFCSLNKDKQETDHKEIDETAFDF